MQFSFLLSMIDGAETAVLVPNINIKCVGPETPYSVEEQNQLVEQVITDGADCHFDYFCRFHRNYSCNRESQYSRYSYYHTKYKSLWWKCFNLGWY